MITSSSLSLRFNLGRVGPGVLLAVQGDAVGRAAGPLLPARTCPANSVCLSVVFFSCKIQSQMEDRRGRMEGQ